MAFDARSGKPLWKIGAAGEILYSEPLDVLVIGRGVYRGNDGQLIWSVAGVDHANAPGGAAMASDAGSGKLLFIVGDKLISYETRISPKHAVVAVFNLVTGEDIGNELEWWQRGCTVLRWHPDYNSLRCHRLEWWQRGCTVLRAGSNLLTTRYLGNAAYFDLASGRMTSISNVRAACSNNLFPADGVLNMPNLSGGCNCNYMPVSQGFVPSSAFK
jgi:hypothetical protein